MRVREFFSGSGILSQTFRAAGHEAITQDIEPLFAADEQADILAGPDLYGDCGVMWFSPPCQTFSVATISRHWKDYKPQSEAACKGLQLLEKSIAIIAASKPEVWFIENPRGMMRKLIDPLFEKYGIKDYKRHTVTYCQYGEPNMKPTDIWTNSETWVPRPACKNGDPCHDRQPRGYKKKLEVGAIGGGTQGKKNAFERGKLPESLCKEIVKSIEKKV